MSFFGNFNEKTIRANLQRLDYSKGLVIDIRNNGGGNINHVFLLSSFFYDQERVLFYETKKLSSKRNDFSKRYPVLQKGRGVIPVSIPVVVLTSSTTFSAANFFAYIMSSLSNCITVGMPTGGGDGPVYSEYLPNGWILTLPYIKHYSVKGECMETGLKPDVTIAYNKEDKTDYQRLKAIAILDSLNALINHRKL